MTDNFRDLIEADATSLLARAGQAVADKVVNKSKELGFGALAAMGSARGAGKLDLAMVRNDLGSQYKYFLKTQQKDATLASFLDFIQVGFGMEVPEGDIYKALYGYDPTKMNTPPQIMAPHQAVMKDFFKVVFNNKSAQPKLLAAAQNLARYAENNEADEDYVVLMVKWLASKNPQALERPGMDPLKPFAHGGRLSKENLDKLLKNFASLLLRQMMILQRQEAQKAAAGGEQKDGENGEGDEENPAAAPNGKQVPSTDKRISFDPPATQQAPNFGGLIPPAQTSVLPTTSVILTRLKAIEPKIPINNFEVFARRASSDPKSDGWWLRYRDGIDSLNYHKLNAYAAQLMYRAVRYSQQQDFIAFMDKFQKDDYGAVVWRTDRIQRAYMFARKGGNFDEITAELNHVAPNSTKASMLLIGILRYIADEEAKKSGGGGTPPGGTPPAGGAPAAGGGGQP